eukprot:4820653-Pleurochrysis_carterae.AAC.6
MTTLLISRVKTSLRAEGEADKSRRRPKCNGSSFCNNAGAKRFNVTTDYQVFINLGQTPILDVPNASLQLRVSSPEGYALRELEPAISIVVITKTNCSLRTSLAHSNKK